MSRLKCLGLVCRRRDLSEDVVLSKPQSKSCPVILVSLHYWLKALKPFNAYRHTSIHAHKHMHVHTTEQIQVWDSDTQSHTHSVTSQAWISHRISQQKPQHNVQWEASLVEIAVTLLLAFWFNKLNPLWTYQACSTLEVMTKNPCAFMCSFTLTNSRD